MKYIIQKALPVDGLNTLNAVVDEKDFPGVNFSNTEYFVRYIKSKYDIGELVVLSGSLVAVKTANSSVYTVRDVNNGKVYTNVKENRLEKAKVFWFINSEGQVCRDFEQRATINVTGLRWKKATGNYYLTPKDANDDLKTIMDAIKNKI